jgi:anti-anti-sigma factor
MPDFPLFNPDKTLPMLSQNKPITYPVTLVNNTGMIHLPKRLTAACEAAILRETFQWIIENEPVPKKIILDFSQTIFIDSSGVGILMHILRSVQSCRIELILWGIHPDVKELFSLLDLDDVFTIESKSEPLNLDVGDQTWETHPSVRSRPKRLLDIVGALVGLSITATVLLPIIIAIQLDNPGPIFFRQTRCGLMGKRFRLWKIRSMVTNAEALKDSVVNQVEGPMFKNSQDPRVTRVGRFLRKTSLDELPQFLNVLQGDMSLVGTRPPTPDEIDRYDIPSWQRLDVKPGMTGEWQVYGRSQVSKFEDVIALDLRYQKRWSLGYDMKLIVKTILVVLTKNSGAY